MGHGSTAAGRLAHPVAGLLRRGGFQSGRSATMTRSRAVAAGVAAVIGLAAVAAAVHLVDTRARAVLDARYPKPPSAVVAATGPAAVVEGRRLAVVTGCTLCHGPALEGPTAGGPAASLRSPNLTLVVGRRADADLDRSIRDALTPDGTSELAMPSYAYRELSDGEVAALLAYLRSLKPQGRAFEPPAPSLLARIAAALGRFHPQAERLAQAKPALDLGPQFAPGRHLAVAVCGQCHGSDLSGGEGLAGPDLTVKSFFTRAQFHELMRSGEMPQNGHAELMQEAARTSLHALSPAEVDAIYDYLMARDVRLAKAKPST